MMQTFGNASKTLIGHIVSRLKRDDQRMSRMDVLEELRDALSLPSIPRRIEGYSAALAEGKAVGGMAVRLAGFAREGQDRSFPLRSSLQGRWSEEKALCATVRRRFLPLADLNAEERLWERRGITVGPAREEEAPFIQRTIAAHAGELDNVPIEAREFLVARRGSAIVAFGRIHLHEDGSRELASLFVAEEERGRHLGCFLSRMLLRGADTRYIYALADPKLEEYYANVGFRTVPTGPASIIGKHRRMLRVYPDEPPCLFLQFDARRLKEDPSLSARPDLLVVDGGRRSLAAVRDTLESLAVTIPVLSAGEGWLPFEAVALVRRLRLRARRVADAALPDRSPLMIDRRRITFPRVLPYPQLAHHYPRIDRRLLYP
jgi:predicted GNAT family N-acyltransferase